MAMEEIKKRKLDELNRRLEEQRSQSLQEQVQLQQQIEFLEGIVKQYLSKEAITRYYTLKTAHPQKALQVVTIIAQAIQNGQLRGKVDDNGFKEILSQLEGPKREVKINKV